MTTSTISHTMLVSDPDTSNCSNAFQTLVDAAAAVSPTLDEHSHAYDLETITTAVHETSKHLVGLIYSAECYSLDVARDANADLRTAHQHVQQANEHLAAARGRITFAAPATTPQVASEHSLTDPGERNRSNPFTTIKE